MRDEITFLCGGCGEEMTETRPNHYKCRDCGVEVTDKTRKKVIL